MKLNQIGILFQSVLRLLSIISQSIELLMFRLMNCYDLYFYTPLQIGLSPLMAKIPRFIHICDRTITIFNANIVTYSRTLLIIPISWSLKYNYCFIGCCLVILHDFLDHVDGIVAKVQKRLYGENIDDPLFGGFIDAFCDKIVNVFCLWTILQETNFEETSFILSTVFVCLCYTIIGLETAIGVVRIQDYFNASSQKTKISCGSSTAAAMEGKLKEKLESIGLAFLCLSTGYRQPFYHWSGTTGIICFLLTIRLAYASLINKLKARTNKEKKRNIKIGFEENISYSSSPPLSPIQKTIGVLNAFYSFDDDQTKSRHRAMTLDSISRQNEKTIHLNVSSSLSSSPSESTSSLTNKRTTTIFSKEKRNPLLNEIKEEEKFSRNSSFDRLESEEDEEQKRTVHSIQRSSSLPTIWIDGRADKVYTIGCFDLFHEGHRLLLQRMRQFGRQVIVGVHDSRSIFNLKSRVPIDGTETRMINVKCYSDQVYCVAGTDPSTFVTCIVHLDENESALYVRGDDMADFPSRHVVEELMPVKFLPYTNGISTTKLRQQLFSHIQSNDLEHLEKVN